VCLSSNASFRTNSDTAVSIVSLLFFWQGGGAIINNGGTAVITGSEFVGNTATSVGNNIFEHSGDVTCNDGTNTFNSPAGNWPAGLCAS
jgi:hypothetical protein